MHFHPVCGEAIVLNAEKTHARRVDGFCNGIIFTLDPVQPDIPYSLLIDKVDEWDGGLSLGLTSRNPDSFYTLPCYACPDLMVMEDFWLKPVREKLLFNGCRLTFLTKEDGSMHIYVNNEYKGVHLLGVPQQKPVWAIVDLYGKVVGASIVDEALIPDEVLANGPLALDAYKSSETEGSSPTRRIRLMIVGNSGAGKSSLVRALLEQPFLPDIPPTTSIDISKSCHVSKSFWNIINEEIEEETTSTCSQKNNEEITVGEEHFLSLAKNLVRELVYNQGGNPSSPKSQRRTGLPIRSGSKTMFRKPLRKDNRIGTASTAFRVSPSIPERRFGRRHYRVEPKHEVQTFEITDKTFSLVESLLKDAADISRMDDSLGENGLEDKPSVDITFNIWDFGGNTSLYPMHQLFLSSRAIYVLVVNMTWDLDTPVATAVDGNLKEGWTEDPEMTYLDHIVQWCKMIHTSATERVAHASKNDAGNFGPRIVIVGTHRDQLHHELHISETQVLEKFNRIRQSVVSQSFKSQIENEFIAVELSNGDDQAIVELKTLLKNIAQDCPFVGQQIPTSWTKLNARFRNKTEKDINFLHINTVKIFAKEENILNEQEILSCLRYLHESGDIFYKHHNLDQDSDELVILSPNWLIEILKRLLMSDFEEFQIDSDIVKRITQRGVLEECALNKMYSDMGNLKQTVISLLQTYDFITLRNRDISDELCKKSSCIDNYWIPTRVTLCSSHIFSSLKQNRVIFYIVFKPFFPESLFNRMMARILKWHFEALFHGDPVLRRRFVRIPVDKQHTFYVAMAPMRYSRLKVIIQRNVLPEEGGLYNSVGDFDPPLPDVCAKIRNTLDSTLLDLRTSWMPRLSYQFMVECNCQRACELHRAKSCRDENCLHFLIMDECLSKTVVTCQYRRIDTSFVRKNFPTSPPLGAVCPIFRKFSDSDDVWKKPLALDSMLETPNWMFNVARELQVGKEPKDWSSLAQRLGYKDVRIEDLGDELNPALSLLQDWFGTSGNMSFAEEMLISCLEQMKRDDLIKHIHKGQETQQILPPIFLSYQWDSQDDVIHIKTKLELMGFKCWIDLGQMGGGDLLYSKIYQGISAAKVFVSCITPKYTMSQSCNREVYLADVLRKPLIPVMLQPTPWPPPGGMALIFSHLLYIDMTGLGGHGGCGKMGDWNSRFQELVTQILRYIPAESYKCPSIAEVKSEAPGGSFTPELSPKFGSPQSSVTVRSSHVSLQEAITNTSRLSSYFSRFFRCRMCQIL